MPTTRSGTQPLHALSDEQVESFLRGNPDFLRERPALLAEILPDRDSDEAVADFQAHALRRLRRDMEDLKSGTEEVILNARNNMSIQARTHEAVVALLEAESFEALTHVITDDLPRLLDVDLIILCFEQGMPKAAAAYVQEMPEYTVDALLVGASSLLREVTASESAIYGAASDLVQSDALVRLPMKDTLPPGLIALGSRHTGAFHNGQGTELLVFLATVIAHSVHRWVAR